MCIVVARSDSTYRLSGRHGNGVPLALLAAVALAAYWSGHENLSVAVLLPWAVVAFARDEKRKGSFGPSAFCKQAALLPRRPFPA